MKVLNISLALWLMILCPLAFAGSGGGVTTDDPEGIFFITPLLERSCVAVRIPINSMEALAGVRWYNNDDQSVFPQLLVASGLNNVPPLFEDGVVVTSDLAGQELGWSEYYFNESYASQSEALYLIFRFPSFADNGTEGIGAGLGYASSDEEGCVFLSADGDEWARLNTNCRLLIEPIKVEREAGMVALSRTIDTPEEEKDIPLITSLGNPFPNPCNPKSNIAFSLDKDGHAFVGIYDLRGHLVKELANGSHTAGSHVVQWYGVNSAGRPVPSGVYLVRLDTGPASFSRRLVLLK